MNTPITAEAPEIAQELGLGMTRVKALQVEVRRKLRKHGGGILEV